MTLTSDSVAPIAEAALDWRARLRRWLARVPFPRLLRRLRWAVPALVLLLAALHDGLVRRVVPLLPPSWQRWGSVFVYGVTGIVVAWIGLTLLAEAFAQREQSEAELRTAYNRLRALYDLIQHLAQSNAEQELLTLAAQAPVLLTDARGSVIFTFDEEGDRLSLDVAWGLSEGYLQALHERLQLGISAERCRTCQQLHAPAESDCPLFRGLQDAARREGIGGLVCFPILSQERRVGLLTAYYASPDGHPEAQLRLLGIVSSTLAAALENLRAQTRQLDALMGTLDQATRPHEALQDLAREAVHLARQAWGASAGLIYLYQEEGPERPTWVCLAQEGLTAPQVTGALLEVAEACRISEEMLLYSEWQAPPELPFRSLAAIPLRSEGNLFGVLILAHERARAFRPMHREILQALGHQIALALRNAQLYAQVHRLAVLEERYRLAREIHDGLAQTLSYLGWQAERLEGLLQNGRTAVALEEVAALRQAIRTAYLEAREAIDGLRLSVQSPGALAERLQEYTAAFARQSGLEVHYTAEPPDLEVPSEMGLQLLRIAQEALNNVRKHARAQRVWVALRAREGVLELSIADDGKGFFAAAPEDERPYRSHGLASMHERAGELGGSLSIATAPGQGTRVLVRVPLPQAEVVAS